MAKKWRYLAVLFAMLPVMALAGCTSVNQRANTQDTWQRIEKRGKIVIGVDDSFVPFGFREKSGRLVGYDVDLARAVFKQYGIKVDFQTIDWSMKENELRNGTIDAIWNGYSPTAERAQKVAFSRRYLQNSQILVTKKAEHINSPAEMQGKVLGLQTGSVAATDLDQYPHVLKDRIKNHQPVLYDTYPSAFIDLKAGRIQGILLDQTYADYYISKLKDKNDYQKTVINQFPKDSSVVGLRKGDRTLLKKVNAGLAHLQKTGELQRLNEKWFGKKSNYLGPVNHWR